MKNGCEIQKIETQSDVMREKNRILKTLQCKQLQWMFDIETQLM